MRHPPTSNGTCAAPCDWLHFAGRASSEGQDWTMEYRSYLSHVDLSVQALELMRRGRLEEGAARLEQFVLSLETLGKISRSIRAVMDRWYYGVLAYACYCKKDFDGADRSMCLANEAIVEALNEARFLMLLSVHCQEFCLHQARIARNRRNWATMYRHLNRARAMTEDRLPLCEMRNGQPIFFSTIADFLRSLEPLSVAERQSVHSILEEGERQRLFDNFVGRLLRIPDFAIDYQ